MFVLGFILLAPAFVSAAVVPYESLHARSCSPYKIVEDIVGDAFYDHFTWFTDSDPTHGRTNYVDMKTARNNNLVNATESSFILRADSKKKLGKGGRGRMSNRIVSKTTYREHLSIIDVAHMPVGDGTWPAFWMTRRPWPAQGELDIIEGINDEGPNVISLHTGPNCIMLHDTSKMKGKPRSTNCDSKADGNQGCGIYGDSRRDYGPAFNAAGGGWWATERTSKAIKLWFFSRAATDVPADIKNGSRRPNPANWGKPTAIFESGDSCDLSEAFSDNNFIINLTFCGDWAGNRFKGGKQACEAYVNNNPEAFKDAYWEIRSLRVYQKE